MTETLTQNDMRVVIIPAKSQEEIKQTKRLRVAAYCRVSTDEDEQINSYRSE